MGTFVPATKRQSNTQMKGLDRPAKTAYRFLEHTGCLGPKP